MIKQNVTTAQNKNNKIVKPRVSDSTTNLSPVAAEWIPPISHEIPNTKKIFLLAVLQGWDGGSGEKKTDKARSHSLGLV